MNIDKIWQSAVHTLDEHKATDIKVLSVGSITSIACAWEPRGPNVPQRTTLRWERARGFTHL